MRKEYSRYRRIGWILFSLYLAALLYLMFFSDMEERGLLVKEAYTYSLVPFLEIRRYIVHAGQIGLRGVMLNLFGNIAGFMPLGFILPVISRRCRRPWYNTVLCAYLLSYGIEMSQLMLRAGSCDVDDIILNTFGGLLGYLVFIIVQRFIVWHLRKRRSRWMQNRRWKGGR